MRQGWEAKVRTLTQDLKSLNTRKITGDRLEIKQREMKEASLELEGWQIKLAQEDSEEAKEFLERRFQDALVELKAYKNGTGSSQSGQSSTSGSL